MKTILFPKQLAPLLAILMIHHLLQANSASIEPDPGAEISGRNRKLRTLPSAPPSPEVDRNSHYFVDPPPPEKRRTARNLRAARKGSPPAPMVSRPRNFRIFPTPTVQRRPPPPPPAVVAGPPTNCNLVPPPPGRNRKLRTLPRAPPSPEVAQSSPYFGFDPPPPEKRHTARNLRAGPFERNPYQNSPIAMKKTLFAKRIAPLLAILIIYHLFQANSALIERDQGEITNSYI
ncbi:hypothetical protein OSB04_009071 [Centaurea solstitialis]|uniref:Uncharacterized protein n=1 Tax=Centaurea solstitialis TaxID=347529 RepID=A0AA38U0P6_9ASTR|nr:hypothetical protein OSB04_009071 [Centaurea solstitialis]